MSRPLIGLAPDYEDGTGLRGGDDRIHHYFTKKPYADAVIAAGGLPVTFPISGDDDLVGEMLDAVDGLMILGSGLDIPGTEFGTERSRFLGRTNLDKVAFERKLLAGGEAAGLPILGICNGLQILNVYRGGTLWQDLSSEAGKEHRVPDPLQTAHPIAVEANTKLAGILGATELDVNSTHHQAVRELGRSLRCAATAADGVVEAVEDPDRDFLVAVQWHPEMMAESDSSKRLFAAFIAAARSRSKA